MVTCRDLPGSRDLPHHASPIRPRPATTQNIRITPRSLRSAPLRSLSLSTFSTPLALSSQHHAAIVRGPRPFSERAAVLISNHRHALLPAVTPFRRSRRTKRKASTRFKINATTNRSGWGEIQRTTQCRWVARGGCWGDTSQEGGVA